MTIMKGYNSLCTATVISLPPLVFLCGFSVLVLQSLLQSTSNQPPAVYLQGSDLHLLTTLPFTSMGTLLKLTQREFFFVLNVESLH